jgi:GSCFA family
MHCPYYNLPATSWWDRAVSQNPDQTNPHLPVPLRISKQTRVASAGSCFAQHISRSLRDWGYNYVLAESPPAFLSPEEAKSYNYGIFSARYGNVYTPLQFLQLVQRALGSFRPADQFWANPTGRHFDLLRPRINPDGFSSKPEAVADNSRHLAAVMTMLGSIDVLIFTLGLTEGWMSTLDGTAYPTCPGCGSAGDYDDKRYTFRNFTVAEASTHLSQAIDLVTQANPDIQIILTVSPVPLIATMEDRHVVQATTYSKSVLRVTAEEMVRAHANVHYFASYEIITGSRSESYFERDERSITEVGVARAMATFASVFCIDGSTVSGSSQCRPVLAGSSTPVQSVSKQVVCDEEAFFEALARR